MIRATTRRAGLAGAGSALWLALCPALCLLGAGCAGTTTQQVAGDMQAALDAAAAIEGAYAASPKADPKVTAQLGHLLAAAQAAVASLQNANGTGEQAAASAAISALVAYEASTQAAAP